MDTTITRPPDPAESSDSFDPTRLWLTHHDQTLLLTTIRRAAAQARTLGRPIVASATRAIPWPDAPRTTDRTLTVNGQGTVRAIPAPDPIAIYVAASRLGVADACYWQQPSADRAFVGVGVASAISGQGADSLRTASAGWRALLRDATDDANRPGQPRCYGGFAFDPLSPRTALWDGFPDALLVLPQLMVTVERGSASLTLNAQVSADDQPEDVAERLIASAMRLSAAVAQYTHDTPTDDAAGATSVALEDQRPAAEWMRLVGATTAAIRAGRYHKVVLARGVQATAQAPFAVGDALRRMRSDAPTATIFAIQRGERTFLAATPERLAQVADGRLRTMALAGTAPRGATPAEDARLGAELTQSAKNRGEHAIVVSEILRAIAPLCVDMTAPETPSLNRLASLQHLMTPVTGELAPGVTALDVVAALHPTPAVGGYPRRAALEAIRAEERLDRGWYAGPVGWLDAQGEGEFVVALRSALLDGARATLFAGCGVVADSDPQAEYAETRIKLQVMLRGLGIEEA